MKFVSVIVGVSLIYIKSRHVLIGSLVLLLFLVFSKPVQASILDNLVNGVKNLFAPPTASPALSLTIQINLAANGDLNKNGQIDAGDTVKFTYKITNPTSESYQLLQLKTNLDLKKLNGLENVSGVLSIDQSNNTLTIPNLILKSNQVRTISFESQVNFDKDADQIISTEAELVNGNSTLIKSEKKEVSAKKMDSEQFNNFVHVTKE